MQWSRAPLFLKKHSSQVSELLKNTVHKRSSIQATPCLICGLPGGAASQQHGSQAAPCGRFTAPPRLDLAHCLHSIKIIFIFYFAGCPDYSSLKSKVSEIQETLNSSSCESNAFRTLSLASSGPFKCTASFWPCAPSSTPPQLHDREVRRTLDHAYCAVRRIDSPTRGLFNSGWP